MPDHKEIWLSPICDECRGEERTWCQNNEWLHGGCECGVLPTRYVLAANTAPALTWRCVDQLSRQHGREIIYVGGIAAGCLVCTPHWSINEQWSAMIFNAETPNYVGRYPTADAASDALMAAVKKELGY